VDTATPPIAPVIPQEAPPLTNPPATLEQVEQAEQAEQELSQADKARVAIGGTPGVPLQEPAFEDEEPAPPPGPADGVWLPNQAKAVGGPRRAVRFRPPVPPEFEFTPPEPQRIHNNNVPLTVGLLLSITASFVVFIVSLGGGSAGADPIMPAFWRGLGALAVLTTLSFAASWFMPAPSDHRQLLEQLEAEDGALRRYRSREEEEAAESPAQVQREREVEAKGASVDVTLEDDEEDLLASVGQGIDEDEDFADLEEDDDFLAASPAEAGTPPATGAGQ